MRGRDISKQSRICTGIYHQPRQPSRSRPGTSDRKYETLEKLGVENIRDDARAIPVFKILAILQEIVSPYHLFYRIFTSYFDYTSVTCQLEKIRFKNFKIDVKKKKKMYDTVSQFEQVKFENPRTTQLDDSFYLSLSQTERANLPVICGYLDEFRNDLSPHSTMI